MRYLNLFGYFKEARTSAEPPHLCDLLESRLSTSDTPDPDYPFVYVDTTREYGVTVFDSGDEPATSFVLIHFCPFCGTELPPPLRDEWFERLDGLGLEIEDPRVPPEMRDETWWRNEGL